MTVTASTRAGSLVHAVIASPIGPLTLVADDGKLAGLYMEVRGHEPEPASLGHLGSVGDDAVLAEAEGQLGAYFAGDLTSFDLPLSMTGTGFQRTVWAALCDIPYGETISYGELARRIGQPSASRAVGLANGRNPVSIVVPCHRVVGANGSLTGYGGGLDRKRYLLALEQKASGQTLA
ncbi:MAG TPA: methylated-DNA--[protein]-cysteine S-methyltransferase [Streptosporangiaceae bacterium]|nr:methylated-DNA--[protein]-cysteine S-methyltransferase [Streptosporangiaceae bacterium]